MVYLGSIKGFFTPACGQVAEKCERRAREAAKRLAEELEDEARVAPRAAAKPHAGSSGRVPAAASTDLHVAMGALLQYAAH